MEIDLSNISFKYDKKSDFAIKNINLFINKNEIIFIMGHTGSGKSTLVQHLNGLLVSDEGEVCIRDDNTYILKKSVKEKRMNDIRKKIGLVFQFSEYQLFEITVLKDVMFGPYNFFKNENIAREKAVCALKEVRIDETYYEKSPFDLSGGEKRKVAIAGIIASNPDVLVMDEPTSNLDALASKEMMMLVRNMKAQGKTIIIISHDVDLCYEYADRVIVMAKGEIIKDDNVEKVFSDFTILKKSGLEEPFVCRAKRILKINRSIRNLVELKEVINNG